MSKSAKFCHLKLWEIDRFSLEKAELVLSFVMPCEISWVITLSSSVSSPHVSLAPEHSQIKQWTRKTSGWRSQHRNLKYICLDCLLAGHRPPLQVYPVPRVNIIKVPCSCWHVSPPLESLGRHRNFLFIFVVTAAVRQTATRLLSLSLSLVSCDWNIPTVAHRLLTDCTSLHTAGPALQTAADNQPCMTLNTWQLLSGRLLTADCARPGCSPLYRRLYGVQYTPHVSLHSIDQHIRRSPPLRQSRWRGWSSVQCPARAAPVLQRDHLTGTSRHSVGLFTAGHQQKLSQHFIILQHRRLVVLTVSQWWHINVSQLISSLLMEAYSVYCCAVWSLVSQLRPGFL